MPMDITHFMPGSGSANTAVTISLSGMWAGASMANTAVTLDDVLVQLTSVQVNVNGAGIVMITTDAQSQSGVFAVAVTAAGNIDLAHSAEIFRVTSDDDLRPIIGSLNPRDPSPAARGTLVTVRGENLDRIESVKIGSQQQTVLQRSGKEMFRFAVPRMTPVGQQVVSMTILGGGVARCPFRLNVT